MQTTLFIRMQLFDERIIEGAFFTLGGVGRTFSGYTALSRCART